MSIVWNLPGWHSLWDPGASGLECNLCGVDADAQSHQELEDLRLDRIPGPVDVFCEECRADLPKSGTKGERP